MTIKLKEARAALDLTQAGLAERLAVHWTTVASWEQGRATPSKATFVFIETLLRDRGLDPDDFRSDEPEAIAS